MSHQKTHQKTHQNPNPGTDPTATECVMETIIGFLLPFFLAAAGGNADTARAAIRQLIDAYNATTATELDLAGRIVGFSIAALDNLRLSMEADLSDTKVLRYRSNAVTLGRASNQARKALEAIRANPDQPYNTPRPSVAPAATVPSPATPSLAAPTRQATPDAVPPRYVTSVNPTQPVASVPPRGQAPLANDRAAAAPPMDIEAMKRDARVMLHAFSKHGAQSAASLPTIADPATMAGAAARAAIAAARRPGAA